jgi:hypothetical protein
MAQVSSDTVWLELFGAYVIKAVVDVRQQIESLIKQGGVVADEFWESVAHALTTEARTRIFRQGARRDQGPARFPALITVAKNNNAAMRQRTLGIVLPAIVV